MNYLTCTPQSCKLTKTTRNQKRFDLYDFNEWCLPMAVVGCSPLSPMARPCLPAQGRTDVCFCEPDFGPCIPEDTHTPAEARLMSYLLAVTSALQGSERVPFVQPWLWPFVLWLCHSLSFQNVTFRSFSNVFKDFLKSTAENSRPCHYFQYNRCFRVSLTLTLLLSLHSITKDSFPILF